MAFSNVASIVILFLLGGSNAFSNRLVSRQQCKRKNGLSFFPPLRMASWSSNEASTAKDTGKKESSEPTNLRPLNQNWWPVVALSALETDRPNGFQVLGTPLVAAWNQGDETWTVLDDRCSHRFAPLSEGRIIHSDDGTSCLQCAYHGWEFDAKGTCTKVPQQPDRVDKARAVTAYPVRQGAGILWVWTDPTTQSLAETIQLPIDPLLERFVDHFGNDAAFMRDLPYGMEILGENLLDLAHLPFAHHSVGGLKRDLGCELPTRMLSRSEKAANAAWEQEFGDDKDRAVLLPTFQAEIVNAADHDPLLKLFRARGKPENTESWTTTIAYFDPCHVRYRRVRGPGQSGQVELFLCPTSPGRSRVFLYNAAEAFLPPIEKSKPSLKQRAAAAVNPSRWTKSVKKGLIAKLFDPRRAAGHMISHQIFDGDGIFLHKQGNRMKQGGLTFKDYSTPSSADVLLNVYRRWLDAAAARTRDAGLPDMADAVVGSATSYGGDIARSEMLDRYNTHTVNCRICTAALKNTRTKRARTGVLQTALVGSTGALVTANVVFAVLCRSTGGRLIPLGLLIETAVVTGLGAWAAARSNRKLDEQINQFLFEDYVHADKH